MINYLFDASPGPEFKFYIPLSILAGALILGSIIFSQIYKRKKKDDLAFKKVFIKVSKRSALMGLLFIFLMLMRFENIPYFSMRLWVYVSLLLLLFFIYKYIKAVRVDYPNTKTKIEVRKAHSSSTKKTENRYLPNKKRRK